MWTKATSKYYVHATFEQNTLMKKKQEENERWKNSQENNAIINIFAKPIIKSSKVIIKPIKCFSIFCMQKCSLEWVIITQAFNTLHPSITGDSTLYCMSYRQRVRISEFQSELVIYVTTRSSRTKRRVWWRNDVRFPAVIKKNYDLNQCQTKSCGPSSIKSSAHCVQNGALDDDTTVAYVIEYKMTKTFVKPTAL